MYPQPYLTLLPNIYCLVTLTFITLFKKVLM
jgi:hypothetical protein